MADTIYCYPDSDVLINHLGIQDSVRLQNIERRLTMLRIMELLDHPIEGEFNLEHLCAIHRYIFQDLYAWAGEIRRINISKGAMFCDMRFIDSEAGKIFRQLKQERYLAGLDQDQFIRKLAYYFSEINALHPFREGNGRSQREFIRSLALKNGYVLSFAKISEEEMLQASQASFVCDYTFMEQLLKKCIRN